MQGRGTLKGAGDVKKDKGKGERGDKGMGRQGDGETRGGEFLRLKSKDQKPK